MKIAFFTETFLPKVDGIVTRMTKTIEFLIKNGYGKFVLREAMSGILNEGVRTDRKKVGFIASINSIINLNVVEVIIH